LLAQKERRRARETASIALAVATKRNGTANSPFMVYSLKKNCCETFSILSAKKAENIVDLYAA
jgi:hypothetical protein